MRGCYLAVRRGLFGLTVDLALFFGQQILQLVDHSLCKMRLFFQHVGNVPLNLRSIEQLAQTTLALLKFGDHASRQLL